MAGLVPVIAWVRVVSDFTEKIMGVLVLPKTLWRTRGRLQRFEPLSDQEKIGEIKGVLRARFPRAELTVVDRAWALAVQTHAPVDDREGKRPRARHVLAVARTLAGLGLDPGSVAAALLHDAMEDASDAGRRILAGRIARGFGLRVAELVTAASRPEFQFLPGAHGEGDTQRLILRRVLGALSRGLEYLPAILIRLAEKLDHMRFAAERMTESQSVDLAREILEAYAPTASRLGVWQIKAELEDRAFKWLYPGEFGRIARQLAWQRPAREALLREAVIRLDRELKKLGISATYECRVKYAYSVYCKMWRKRTRQVTDIHDLAGIRVIVETVEECFRVLESIHCLWVPILEEFDNYISFPKENGYQSIHTAVVTCRGQVFEAQIRTREMHEVALYGLAAFWRYRGYCDPADEFLHSQFSAILRHLRALQSIRDVEEYVSALGSGLPQSQVSQRLSSGQLRSLPMESTLENLSRNGREDLAAGGHMI
jgi:guanosine-3',5'-bis(diphosphate) 3'-pyrophosphohydrolase